MFSDKKLKLNKNSSIMHNYCQGTTSLPPVKNTVGQVTKITLFPGCDNCKRKSLWNKYTSLWRHTRKASFPRYANIYLKIITHVHACICTYIHTKGKMWPRSQLTYGTARHNTVFMSPYTKKN